MLHEILTNINVYICKVGMPPSHHLIFPFDPLEWVNYQNVMRWAYRRLKTNKEKRLTKHVGFVYAYAKKAKNRNINDEKGGDKRKTQKS